MARRPGHRRQEPLSRLARVIDNIIRHKLKWIFGAVLTIGPAGLITAYAIIEPGMPAFHYWVRDQITDDHNYIVYLKLKEAKQAMKDAKGNLAKNPDDGTAQRAADYYEAIIKKYQHQLDVAAGNK